MQEKIEKLILEAINSAQEKGTLPPFEINNAGVERPADANNGDLTSTAAMRSAKLAHMAPRAIAEAIVANIAEDSSIDKVEIAGPGFINFYFKTESNNQIFKNVRDAGKDFGRSKMGGGEKMQVEFISANPTGPLHIGHGRWAALGDSLANVLDFAGYDIQREYYVNDHGSQMDVFGDSVAERYLQLNDVMKKKGVSAEEAYDILIADREAYVDDEEDAHPENHPYMNEFNEHLSGNAYGGDFIIDLALEFYKSDGDKWVDVPSAERDLEFRERGYKMQLGRIKQTCDNANCHFDNWKSERSFYEPHEDGKSDIDNVFAKMDEMGLLYTTDDGAMWVKTSEYGDDKDRVVKKSNGEWTYFASDVAYDLDKLTHYDYEINILGADHHGYINRVVAVANALGYPGKYEVLLGQFVNLLRGGKPVRMSKRRGTMITFDELLAEAGCDATRYTLISRASTQMIDFDIEAVSKQDSSNPVYYVQYAHARICSILRRAAGISLEEAEKLGMDEVARRAVGDTCDYSLLTTPAEASLARTISTFPELIENCARDRAPFRLTHYLQDLAGEFHHFYTECPILGSEAKPVAKELSCARLAACDAVRINLEIALKLIGVSAPEQM